MSNSKVFFPGLNGLRFIAAFAVVVHHLEQIKLFFGLPSVFYVYPIVKIMGELGVTLFFTLSGFLITYLLLVEKERFKTIAVKDFYIRRVLRIWPLYYAVIIAGLFILPHIHFFDIPTYTTGYNYKFGIKAALYFLLLPNVVSNLYAYMPYLAQTWSIGIEEQFYYIWPWIMKFTKRYLMVLLSIIFGLIIVTSALSHFANHADDISQSSNSVKAITLAYKFFRMLRISCMAIGGLAAYWVYTFNVPILKFVFSRATQLVNYAILLTLICFGFEFPLASHEIYSVMFAIVILNVSSNHESYLKLENKIANYLGKISYSIYMWHGIAIIIGLHIARLFKPDFNNLGANAIYYVSTFAITLAMAAASYTYFETPFLKYKHIFAKVDSGNDIKMKSEKGKVKNESSLPAVSSEESEKVFDSRIFS